MKNKYLIIMCTIIFCTLSIISSCRIDTAATSEEEMQKITEVSEIKETAKTMDITVISDIKEEEIGKEFTVKGKIIFIHEPPDGLFLEIEDESGNIGIFIEKRILSTATEDIIGGIQKGATIKVKGILNKNQERLLLIVGNADSVEIIAEEEKKSVEETELIAAESPDNYQLDVGLVYSGNQDRPGLCYLGAFSMLLKFKEPKIEFFDIIAASGIGIKAGYIDSGEASVLGNGVGEACIILATDNLNTSFTLGLNENGNDSAPYYPPQLRFGNQAKEVVYFNDAEDAFAYLKYVVSSGNPVVVYLDCYYLYDDFVLASDFWKNSMEKDHYDHYMVVTGYDKDNIYLNDPTDPTEAAANIPAKLENFMQAWEKGSEVAQKLGPFWMIYLSGPVSQKPFNEVIQWNIDMSKDAVSEIRKFAENPNSLEPTCFLLNELGRARTEFSNYLNNNGMAEPALLYKQSGEIFSGIAFDMSVTTEKLNMIIDKESEAVKLLIK